jgi:hypothetical protein
LVVALNMTWSRLDRGLRGGWLNGRALRQVRRCGNEMTCTLSKLSPAQDIEV